MADFDDPVLLSRNDRLDAIVAQLASQSVGIISAVGDEPFAGPDLGEQRLDAPDIAVLAGGQVDGDRPAEEVGGDVDLRGAPASRDADRLILRRFFGRRPPSGGPSHRCCRRQPCRRDARLRSKPRASFARSCGVTMIRQQADHPISEGDAASRPWRRLKRLSIVVRGPYSGGQSRQRQPDRSTWKMPLKTRRSSTRRAPGWFFGSIGSASKKTAHAAEQQRPDVWQRRLAWFEVQPELAPERLTPDRRNRRLDQA